MIQDIAPAYLDNAYREISPDASDAVLCFEEDRILAGCDADGESLFFPVPAQVGGKFVYAFSIGEKRFFLALEAERLPEDFPRYSLRELREMRLRATRTFSRSIPRIICGNGMKPADSAAPAGAFWILTGGKERRSARPAETGSIPGSIRRSSSG